MAAKLTTVRAAQEGDLPRIREIYNNEVLTSTATYDTQPRTAAEQRKWFSLHGGSHPVFVAEQECPHFDGESSAVFAAVFLLINVGITSREDLVGHDFRLNRVPVLRCQIKIGHPG